MSLVSGKKHFEKPCFAPCHLRLLTVPEHIHEAWKKGGESRQSLLKMFTEAGFDKENLLGNIVCKKNMMCIKCDLVSRQCWGSLSPFVILWYLDATIVRVFPGKNVKVQSLFSNQGAKTFTMTLLYIMVFPNKKD